MSVLNEIQAYELFERYAIKVLPYYLCSELEDAYKKAEILGYPLVMKIVSKDIPHKTEAGGVVVGVKDHEDLKSNWHLIMENAIAWNKEAQIDGILLQKMSSKGMEFIMGVKKDQQFGHIILCGLGGIYTEVFEDIAIRLLPISREDALEMVKEVKAYKILSGFRGQKYDIEAVVDTLLALSNLIKENQDIEEIDLNPTFVYPEGKGVLAADGLVIKNS